MDITPITERLNQRGRRLGIPLSKQNARFISNVFRQLRESDVLVLDVGANAGWFSKAALRFCPEAKIVAFEPLPSKLPILARIKQLNSMFEFRNLAVGESPVRQIVINEYAKDELSSIMALKDGRLPVARHKVSCVTLDSIAEELKGYRKKACVLKIDTQGFELSVLRGAKELLALGFFDVILLESSTVGKYEGAPLFAEVISFLHDYSYELCDVNAFDYGRGGWLLELDVAFRRIEGSP